MGLKARTMNCLRNCNVSIIPTRNFKFSSQIMMSTVNATDKTNYTERETYFKNKFDNFIAWYEHFIGLDEVRTCQDRVIMAQERLIDIQEQRRQTSQELNALSKKRSEITDELIKTSKEDRRYLALITEEHQVLTQERDIKDKFNSQERQERDYFTFLSNAVRDSHEKQRMQAEKTKYWGLILSICSSALAWSVADWKHKRILTEFITNINKDSPKNIQLQPVLNKLDETSKILQTIKTSTFASMSFHKNVETIESQVKCMEKHYKKLDENVTSNFGRIEKTVVDINQDMKKLLKSVQHSGAFSVNENQHSNFYNDLFVGAAACVATYLILSFLRG